MDGQGDSSDGSGGIDLGGGRPSIDISSSARAVSSAPKRKVRGPYDRKIADAGEHVALFLVADPERKSASFFTNHVDINAEHGLGGAGWDHRYIVGVITCRPVLRRPDHEVAATLREQRRALFSHSVNNLYGYCDYCITNRFSFDEPHPIGAAPISALRLGQWSHELRDARLSCGKSCSDALADHDLAMPTNALVKGVTEARCMLWSQVQMVHCVRITGRTKLGNLVPHNPTAYKIRKFVRECKNTAPEVADEDHVVAAEVDGGGPLFHEPRCWLKQAETYGTTSQQAKPTISGEHVVRQLSFAQYLKDFDTCDLALEQALEVYFPDDAEEVKAMSDTTVSSGDTLKRSKLRLDPTAMLMERRELHHLLQDPGNLASTHIHSDGSPVTGTEIQGMVLTLIFLSGAVYRFVLPGMCLHYGHCRVIDKTIAFLWSLWLVAGPDERLLRIILDVCHRF